MQVKTIVTGPFQGNAYLVWGDRRTDGTGEGPSPAILIDPGDDAERLKGEIEREGLRLVLILATHAHLDHVGAAAELRRWSGAPLCLPEGEQELLRWLPEAGLFFGVAPRPVPDVDYWLDSGEKRLPGGLSAELPGGWEIVVRATPGHSPDGVCYQIENHLFTGDTLFSDSVGRTDLPGGHWPTLEASLRYLSTLPEDIVVWPGHGPQTTIGQEKRHNPFLREAVHA